jgi:zinc protease
VAQKTQVVKEVLPNGVTVLAGEDHSSPVVAINLWVRAGYFDEEDAEIGISHVIEHMFFKGTPDRPRADQIASEIKALGGELNAGTYYDSTNYYVVLPSENYRKGLEIEADALMHPLIDADELTREIEAVIQEGRRKKDTPGAYALEMMFREAFETHRIRRWRIGEEDALRAFTRDHLLSYFWRWSETSRRGRRSRPPTSTWEAWRRAPERRSAPRRSRASPVSSSVASPATSRGRT